MRSWRNWCKKKHNTFQHCITTNAYWGLEINAHSLINYIVNCRNSGAEFHTTLLQSQTCEATFRDARAFTSTESTVVNFTMQGFESRLNKIQCKKDIMHRNEHTLNFPSMKRQPSEADVRFEMPTNEDITAAVENAQQSVREILLQLGVDAEDISFESSVTTHKPKSKLTVDCGDFEFISIPVEIEPCMPQNNEDVHNAVELFENIGEELLLPDSKNFKNVFKIRNQRNKIVHVKKRTFLWMLTSGMQKCSVDRTYRFFDKQAKKSRSRYVNEILEDITAGEYLLMKEKEQLSVLKVYSFKYLKGKKQPYTLPTVPTKVPENVVPRGIGLLGSTFEISECDGDYILEFTSNNVTIDVKHYMSHLRKPSVLSALFYYPEETVIYINSFKLNH